MNTLDEKYVGEGKIKEEVLKKLIPIIKDNAVATKHIQDGAVTADKLSMNILEDMADKISVMVLDNLKEIVVTDKFGDSTAKAISQRLMTDTVNDIYAKLRDLNGEPPVGLYLTATPEYFIGEEGADVHIEAVSTSGVFEHIAFYMNDELLPNAEAESVYRFSYDTHISDTSVVKCVATILGITYETSKRINHYTSFWIGAGTTYQDIFNLEHNVPVENIIRGSYDITCNQGDHMIIIIGEALKDGFIRADLNGFEIPFSQEIITKDGNNYWVYTSENVYKAGRYNIDING